MKKVIITPGCISCGACEFAAPEIFEVTDVARVKQNSDCKKYAQEIEKALLNCPVQVIKYQEKSEKL